MITLTLKDDGLADLAARLGDLLADLSPVMNDIGQQLARSAKDRIDRGVSPDGTAFAPRSPATLAAYDRKGWRYKGPLHRSGDMRADIFHGYGPGHAAVGVNAIQSAVMQFGQKKGASGSDKRGRPIPWGDIPARPFLGLSEEDRTAIGAIVEEWLGDALAAGG